MNKRQIEQLRERMEARLPDAIAENERNCGYSFTVAAQGDANLVDISPARKGVRGFYETVCELASIPDAENREAATVGAFGGAASDFLEFINLAAECRQLFNKENNKEKS
jgi:hypothetical protein